MPERTAVNGEPLAAGDYLYFAEYPDEGVIGPLGADGFDCEDESANPQASPAPRSDSSGLTGFTFINSSDQTAIEALRFLAANPHPSYGNERFNTEHLYQIAGELERSLRPSSTQE